MKTKIFPMGPKLVSPVFPLLAITLLPLGTAYGHISGATNWSGGTSDDWADAANWSTATAPLSGGGENDPPVTYPIRINLNNGSSGNTLIYSAAQGHTIYTGVSGRVLGSSSNAGGSMTITGGIFESRGASGGDDFIGFNGANTGTWVLTLNGGTYTNINGNGTSFRLGYTGGTQTMRLDIKDGNFIVGGIRWGWNNSSTGITGTINLDGGTLATGSLAETNTAAGAITSLINFNGGTLKARANNASFMTAAGIDTAKVLSNGAIIDTNGFNITIAKALTEDESSTGGGLTKLGAGTLTLSANNGYTGGTTVTAGTLLVNGSLDAASGVNITGGLIGGSGTIGGPVTVGAAGGMAPGAPVGTLTIGGDLNLSAMAGGAGKLFFELDVPAASDRVAVAGALDIGSGVLGFSDFDFTGTSGLQAGTYTLITSGSSIIGTLNATDLNGTVGANNAELRINGNNIELVVEQLPVGTLVIDLGAGTVIPGGTFGTYGALNLPIPPLPSGSILRSIEVDAALVATDNDNFASDFAVLFDPTPATPGEDFSVIITNGTIKFQAAVQLGWSSAAYTGPPSPLVDTKSAAAWATAGDIDLATTGIFLGNSYDHDSNAPTQGGTWSGTITLTYDLVASGTPYEIWASTNAPTGNADDDFDGDGVPNGVEYVLGGLASTNDLAKLPAATSNSGNLLFSFIRDQQSIDGATTVQIEVGTDLANWPTLYNVGVDSAGSSAGVTISQNDPENGLDTVTLSVAQATDPKKFARLKVTTGE
jgi:autotransporter-associated beta strand protein